MRQHLIGLAAAMAMAAVSAPASANCGGCAPSYSYSYASCAQPAYNPCGGSWGYATMPQPVQYYAAQPQYYYVNQGPTYAGPGMFAPVASYQQRAVAGWAGYSRGYYRYSGGPYAHPTHHHYHGMPAVSTPTVYSYRRAYRPSYRYGYSRQYTPRYSYYTPRAWQQAPRYGYAPRVYRAPRVHYAPRAWAPRPAAHYGHRHYAAPRYSVAPHQYGQRQRVLRRYN